MRKLLLTLLIALIPMTAYAIRVDGTVDATDDQVAILTLNQYTGQGEKSLYEAFLNIAGTFNGCTIHYLVSTDGGTNKVALQDSSGAVTSTAADNFLFRLGYPSGSASTIVYASAAGCSGTPALAIDIDDNRP